jgi:Tfp pilus assembly protein PilV
MPYAMLTRARKAEAEDGFIIIEVLVSALILAIVAGAVLALITATTHSAASERNHSVAYGLAQEDQARLRTLRLASLNEKNETSEPTIGGTKYVVRSQGRFVNNNSGTRSCTAQNASTDYVEITSTVSSRTMLNPVVLHSVVAPTNGSLDPSHGSLAIQAENATAKPVSGVTATISGPSNGTATTGEEGCAIFADIPAGVYQITFNGHTLINREGKSEETLKSVGVEPGGTAQVPIYFDKPGSIAPSFLYAEAGNPTLQPAGIDSMMVYDSDSGKPAANYGSPGTYPVNPATPLKVEKAYPFAAPYSVYAGSCIEDEPTPPSPAMPAVPLKPGEALTPAVQVPSLEGLVTFEGKSVKGATVILTDTQCPQVGNKVKRTFTTNANGHVALSTTTPAEAIGLPWSTYEICVSATLTNSQRKTESRRLKVTTPLAVETVAAPVSTALNLSGTGSSGSTSTELKC